jgi:hypothetical protein
VLWSVKAAPGQLQFLMKTLARVATQMALHVLAYNLTRVMNILGPGRLIAVKVCRCPNGGCFVGRG